MTVEPLLTPLDTKRAGVAWLLLLQAAKTVEDSTEAALAAGDQLPMAELRALHQIVRAGEGGLRPSDLADLVGASRSAASRSTASLRAKGLVVREASSVDRREYYLYPTEAGVRAHETGIAIVNDLRNRTFVDVLGPDDFETLIRILSTYVNGRDLVKEFGPRSAQALQHWLGV